jgi:hypothetical protein
MNKKGGGDLRGLFEQYNLNIYCFSLLGLGTKNCRLKMRIKRCKYGINNNNNNNNKFITVR